MLQGKKGCSWCQKTPREWRHLVHVCVLVAQSCPTLCDPMDSIAYQAPLFVGFSRQGYWSGLPFPSPGHLPDPGIKPGREPGVSCITGGFLHCRQILCQLRKELDSMHLSQAKLLIHLQLSPLPMLAPLKGSVGMMFVNISVL